MTKEIPTTDHSVERVQSERANIELDAFVYNPALEAILEANGFSASKVVDVDRTTQLKSMQDFATEKWDARRGRERQAVDWGSKPAEESEFYEHFTELV